MKKTVSGLFLSFAIVLAWPSQAATVKTVSILGHQAQDWGYYDPRRQLGEAHGNKCGKGLEER